MSISPTPPGFHSITPYFVVNGAVEFIAFLESAFGATVVDRHLTPEGKVMHAALKIGDSMVELSDAKDEWPPMTMAVHHYTPDTDATYQSALAEGAMSLYVPTDHPYGERGAGVRDAWGNHWYIGTRTAEWVNA